VRITGIGSVTLKHDAVQMGMDAHASVLAAVTPISSDPISPGRWATAIASSSSNPHSPAAASASRSTGRIFSRWARLAISGTTPRYFACSSTCDATIFERTKYPSATTAAAVSSQVDSMPRIRLKTQVSLESGRARFIPPRVWIAFIASNPGGMNPALPVAALMLGQCRDEAVHLLVGVVEVR
jgi:hypothetical protein